MTDFVAIEVDTYVTGGPGIVTRYISNTGPLVRTAGGSAAYQPRLKTYNLSIAQSISVNDYGQTSRASPTGGTFEFVNDPTTWSWFGSTVHWLGAPVRLYAGSSTTGNVSDLILLFTGKVKNLTVDRLAAQVSVEEVAVALDDSLVTDLYTTGALANLVGLPKPQVWGTVTNVAPVLEDNANQIYRVSRLALDTISAVRLGGIACIKVSGVPKTSQWHDLGDGTFQLGGTTSGAEVRCDARSSDYASMTTAYLIQQIAAAKGVAVNAASMAQLNSDFGALIGYYTTTQLINAGDVLDEVTKGGGCYWGLNAAGEIIAGIFQAPGTPTITLDNVSTMQSQATDLVPPAWRIRVEHTRNWAPQNSFAPETTPGDQAIYSATGSVAPEWSDASIKTAEPLAIDVELIRSLVQSEAGATAIRDRLRTAWSTARKLYTIETRLNLNATSLYATATLSASMFNATTRIVSITPAFGGGSTQVQLWG